MAKAIFLKNPQILDQAILRFGFDVYSAERTEDIRIFKSGEFFLFFSEKVDANAIEKIAREYLVTELYFLDFANGAGSESRVGDIILPAFFFPYDRSVETLEEDREHFSSIGKDDVVFLEAYETQGDYDFGEFAMSIGGGAVSLGETKAPNRLLYPKVSAAYGIDVIDESSFELAKVFSTDIKFYAVLCMKSDRIAEISTVDEEKKLATNAVEILKFLVESTSEENFIQITEENDFSNHDPLTDDDYDE